MEQTNKNDGNPSTESIGNETTRTKLVLALRGLTLEEARKEIRSLNNWVLSSITQFTSALEDVEENNSKLEGAHREFSMRQEDN